MKYSLCPYQGLNGCLGLLDYPIMLVPPFLPSPSSEDVDLEAFRTLWKALVKQRLCIGGEPAKPTSLGSWPGHSHFGLGAQRSRAWASSYPALLQGWALERGRLLQPPGPGCCPRRTGRQDWLTQPSSSFRYLVCGSPLALALAQKWQGHPASGSLSTMSHFSLKYLKVKQKENYKLRCQRGKNKVKFIFPVLFQEEIFE